MAGACCGRIYRMEPAIAASDCNAIQKTDTGWMVPETEVVGVAPGTAVGDERSVDGRAPRSGRSERGSRLTLLSRP